VSGAGATINITGDLIHQESNAQAACLHINAVCAVNITGGNGSISTSGGSSGRCIWCQVAASSITITGNLVGSSISGNVSLITLSTSPTTIIGSITGGLSVLAVDGSGSHFYTGPLIMSTTGVAPTNNVGWRWHSTLTPTYYAIRNRDNTAYRNLYTSDNADSGSGQPATNNVRSGTVYGPTNEFTGTCVVPSASSVAFGVPVDATTGTAVLTQQNVQDALASASIVTLNQQTSSLNTPGSIGERLKLASTVATTAQQLSDALSNE
jgi:hypothetical protein